MRLPKKSSKLKQCSVQMKSAMSSEFSDKPLLSTARSRSAFQASTRRRFDIARSRFPLDTTSVTEPAAHLLPLVHHFLDPAQPRSKQTVAAILEKLAAAGLPQHVLNGPGNQAVISSYGRLPYHVLRLDNIIPETSRNIVLAAFHDFDKLRPYKHVPKTQCRTTLDLDHHFHPYHFAIVARNGNTLGTTKDLLQTTRANIANPSSIQQQRRSAAFALLHSLDKYVATPVRRYYQHLDNDSVSYGFHLSHFAERASIRSGTHAASYRLGGLACGVAFGYGEARFPHLDINDTLSLPSLIVQLSGSPACTHFPQLGLDVRLAPGDAILAPTSGLIHHGSGSGSIDENRITAVFYTDRHMENIIGRSLDGVITGGVFDGLAEDQVTLL